MKGLWYISRVQSSSGHSHGPDQCPIHWQLRAKIAVSRIHLARFLTHAPFNYRLRLTEGLTFCQGEFESSGGHRAILLGPLPGKGTLQLGPFPKTDFDLDLGAACSSQLVIRTKPSQRHLACLRPSSRKPCGSHPVFLQRTPVPVFFSSKKSRSC